MRWPRPWRRRKAESALHLPIQRWAEPAYPPVESRVRLGFADGSQAELPAEHPTAVALSAAADVLLGGPQ